MDALCAWMRYDPPPNDLLVKVAGFGAQSEQDPESQAVQEHANWQAQGLGMPVRRSR